MSYGVLEVSLLRLLVGILIEPTNSHGKRQMLGEVSIFGKYMNAPHLPCQVHFEHKGKRK